MNWKMTIASLLWISAIATGAIILSRYSNTAGMSSDNKINWPKTSKIRHNEGRAMLLIFAHPHCPCSAASVGELERLMPFLKNKVDVTVVFTQPEGRSPAWVQSSLWDKAKDIPGVGAMIDSHYQETDLFGAKTSGQVFLYDGAGALIFSGGITPARGHMGDSLGRQFILSWVEGKPIERKIAQVFGCALKEGKLIPNSNIGLEER